MLAVTHLIGLGNSASAPIPPLDQSITWTTTTAGTATFARSNSDRTLRISGSVINPFCESTTFTIDTKPRYLEMIVTATSYATDARNFQLGADESAGATADTATTATYGWYVSGVAATDTQQVLAHGATATASTYTGAALPVRLGIGMRQATSAITLWQNGVLLSTLTGGSIATHLAGSLKLRAGLNVTATRDAYFQILTSAEALYLPPGYGYV